MKYLQLFEKYVESDAIRNWFGSSKIVDTKGEPLVVYHATTKDFDNFSHDFLDTNTNIVNNFLGFYFTDNAENSKVYISNGFDTKKGYKKGASIMPFYLKIEKPKYLSKKKYWELQMLSKEEILDYKDRLMMMGYDGIVWKKSVWKAKEDSRDYTIFNANQAKPVYTKVDEKQLSLFDDDVAKVGYKSLVGIVDYPRMEDELISNYLTYSEYENDEFRVTTINPVEWFKTCEVDGSGTTIEEAFKDHSEAWQRKLVKRYQKDPTILDSYIIIYGDNLVDGFHRLTAMALNGVTSVKAIDIAEIKE
jgi:hypothetical protein